MLNEYSISDIIVSNPKEKYYYVGTFEQIENPNVDWPHRHNFYSLVWFTSSVGINVIDFEEFEIRPNRLFLMRPKQVHNWSYSENSKGYTLVVDKHMLNKELLDLFNTSVIDLTEKKAAVLNPLFKNLIEESRRKDKLGETIVLTGISYLFNQLKRMTKNDKYSTKVKSDMAIEFSKLVAETVSENLSVKNYAKKLHITPEKLVDICKDSFAQSPKSIILEKKITEAKRLLYFTDKTINEVAFDVGFEDSSYFSRLFKQKTKHSPSNFKSA